MKNAMRQGPFRRNSPMGRAKNPSVPKPAFNIPGAAFPEGKGRPSGRTKSWTKKCDGFKKVTTIASASARERAKSDESNHPDPEKASEAEGEVGKTRAADSERA